MQGDDPVVSKKNKKKKTNRQVVNKNETTGIKEVKQTELAVDSMICTTCSKSVPKMNFTLHQLRCKSSSPATTAVTAIATATATATATAAPAVRPKQKLKVKPMPKVGIP